jgi:multiple sugar transport system substrate-binding protein
MPEIYSRRSFLSGVLACGALSAAATWLLPGGRSPGSIDLRLVSGADRTGARDLLIQMWNQANPRARARVVSEITSGSGDERTRMLAFAENGEADILNLDIIDVPEFAKRKAITPIHLDAEQEFLDPVRAVSRVADNSGRYWAAPLNTDVGMLFTRGAQPPGGRRSSLAEVLDTKVPAGSGQFVGQLQPNASNNDEGFVVNVLEHALSRDETLLSRDGTVSFDLNRWQRALRPLRRAIADGKIALAGSERDGMELFSREKLRFMRNWPVSYRELQQEADPDVRTARIGVTPLPVGILGGQSLALVAGSPHAEQARRFIGFLTNEPAQKILAAHGFAPTRRGAYGDDDLQVLIPHLRALRQAVEDSRPRPVHPRYRQFADAMRRHTNDHLHGRSELTSEFIADIKAALGD